MILDARRVQSSIRIRQAGNDGLRIQGRETGVGEASREITTSGKLGSKKKTLPNPSFALKPRRVR